MAQGLWRWTTRVDTSLSTPAYLIRDIMSPFGLMRDMVPIPGEVIEAMASSINDIRTNFQPTILLSPSGLLTFLYDEGRGFSPAQEVQVTNNGPYGSILGVSVTSSAPYLRVSPALVGNLQSNEAGKFDVSVDTTGLIAASSPYSATLMVQGTNATNTPQLITVTINVRPLAMISASPTVLQFFVTGPGNGGPFPPIPVQQFIVQNLGAAGSLLDFQISRLTGCSPWLISYTPATGVLASSAIQPVSVVVQPAAGTLQGTYEETLRVSGFSSNSYQDVLVRLTVF